MRRLLTFWNLLGLVLFTLGALVYWQSQGWRASSALPLPSEETSAANSLPVILYLPNPPQGLLKETRTLELAPGDTPENKVLAAWAEALQAPKPRALYRLGKLFVVDLPADFALGLDASQEALRLYSLAYTLLSTFPQAQEVRFLVEGEPKPGLAHLDLSQPFRLP
ncbi:GerMN domain-containing protein [Thermus sp. NMX2.A1]|uniref:GerMN domain-containing protein n=1 Tax=Thermus sp. NMX2.A1 TaxID=570924 RepID=UPI0003DDD3A8|nr:GerMN domain-containing protein [Thermus sp. NMX2.A1]ETN88459.1 sporulation/spore germination protein [Thermus sp. NMX2.A1]